MAEAKCDVSFNIKYNSSEPITKAAVHYEYPPGTPITYNINPLPQSGDKVVLNDIQAPGTYNLEVELAVGSISAMTNTTLTVGRCSSASSCEFPKIESVEVLKNGQIVMKYFADTTNLATLEYQIATDSEFTNIIYVKVGFSDINYTLSEYIDMKNGKILNNTKLYIRIRKYCKPDGISDWSNVVEFQSGEWNNPVEAYCLPADGDDLNQDICYGTRGFAWKTKVTLTTSQPEVGSLIYLTNGKLAIPENIKNLGQTAPDKFKDYGIRWIRFPSFYNDVVFVVDSKTGRIEDSFNYKC